MKAAAKDDDRGSRTCRPDLPSLLTLMIRLRRAIRAKPRLEGEPGAPRILFLDDDPDRAGAFLARNPTPSGSQTAEDCIARLEEPGTRCTSTTTWEASLRRLEPARLRDGGRPLALHESRARFENTLFIIHSHNAEAGEDDGELAPGQRLPGRLPPLRGRSDRVAAGRGTGGRPEEDAEEPPPRPAKPGWSEWIRRLSRKLRPRTPPTASDPADASTRLRAAASSKAPPTTIPRGNERRPPHRGWSPRRARRPR